MRILWRDRSTAAPLRRRAFEIHENHERAIHEFAMPVGACLVRIKLVPTDRLPVQASTTPQEKHHEMGKASS
jgi:hypothetical protein